MNKNRRGPYDLPRHCGTIIVVHTTNSPMPTTAPINLIATLIAAGTGMRVGVMHSTPKPHARKRYQPAEALLAACNNAAGRMMGVKPVKRDINMPAGVDWFAPRLSDSLTPQDWIDVYQEARSSRGVLIVVDPVEEIYRDITLRFDEELRIEECDRKIEYPEVPAEWKEIAVMVLHTIVAVRALYVPPVDPIGADATFGSPLLS